MNRTNENFLLLTINVSTYAMWLYWQLILYPPPLLRNCAAAAALSLAKWLIVFVVLLALQVCSFAKRVVNAFIEAEVTLSEDLWIFLRLLFYHHFSCFRWTFTQTKTYEQHWLMHTQPKRCFIFVGTTYFVQTWVYHIITHLNLLDMLTLQRQTWMHKMQKAKCQRLWLNWSEKLCLLHCLSPNWSSSVLCFVVFLLLSLTSYSSLVFSFSVSSSFFLSLLKTGKTKRKHFIIITVMSTWNVNVCAVT